MTDLSEALELFLLHLRYKEGKLVRVQNNRPLLLNDPDVVWIVYAGLVDVFSAPLRDDDVDGAHRHLFRCPAGEILFGVASDDDPSGIGLRVSGTPGTTLLQLSRARLIALSRELEFQQTITEMLEQWVTHLSGSISDKMIPKAHTVLRPNKRAHLDADTVVLPPRGILWAQATVGGLHLLGQSDLDWRNGDGHLPVSRHTWAQTEADSELSVIDTDTFMSEYDTWAGLDRFHRLVLRAIVRNRVAADEQETERLQHKAAAEQSLMQQALAQLASPLAAESDADFGITPQARHNMLLAACRLVGEQMGIDVVAGDGDSLTQAPGQALREIAHASHMEMRAVRLRADWWQRDNGPLLGFLDEKQRPVALLRAGDGYELVNPTARTRVPLTPAGAQTLMPVAYSFYRPFPQEAMSLWQLLRFGLKGSERDLTSILALSLLIALIGLLPPVVTGWLFDTVIPQAQSALLWQIGIGLVVLALTAALLRLGRGVGFLRTQTRLDATVQAGVWMRLLSLPVSFFRRYTAGDLGTRALGISTIRHTLSGYVVTTIVTAVFSVTNLALLFVYSAKLALVALALVTVAIAVTLAVSAFYLRHQKAAARVQGEVAGTVLQLLTGVAKIRVAGAENHAFARWANAFTRQKRLNYKSRFLTALLTAFNAAYPLLASLVIFAMMAMASVELTTGDFLAFNAAFIQFLMAWSMLGGIIVLILPLIPVYDRLKPILEATPEVHEGQLDPGELSGALEVSHVSFRYDDNGPPVLKDVSLQVEPGEFVAFVGPSGSGKSTLLRLLLGFEQAESGGIYVDGNNLQDLDIQAVRQQIGVVLQNATLMSEDIYSNIAGSDPNLTLDDAWEAARLAGLEDEIKRLPMGMHTVISERGSNFSGGQRQRLLIARALVTRPRLLFFDEATSALDNRSQDVVGESLEAIQATRIVVAHRLSTIMNADRIYVFEQGRIVQSGTYEQLLQKPGPFADLAKRQML